MLMLCCPSLCCLGGLPGAPSVFPLPAEAAQHPLAVGVLPQDKPVPTLVDSIARNLSLNMSQWAQAQQTETTGSLGNGPGDATQQAVEAVARAAAAAAAAAATAVIQAAGEQVQNAIRKKAAQGFLPFW